MRGIGKGQTLVLFVPPEVRTLQQVEVALGRGVTREARAAALAALPHAGRARAELEDVASWLMLNAMRAEKVQFELWCSQCAHNVWRKRAMAVLASRHAEFGNHATVKGGSAVPEAHRAERRCLDVFRDRVEHDVSNTVPRRGNVLTLTLTLTRTPTLSLTRCRAGATCARTSCARARCAPRLTPARAQTLTLTLTQPPSPTPTPAPAPAPTPTRVRSTPSW